VQTTYTTTGTNRVAMISTWRCNGHRDDGCAKAPASATVGESPVAIAIDRRAHTVYVANYGAGATGTVSVFDARGCNATRTAGCRSLSTLEVPGGNPDDLVVDPATGTLYVATITSGGSDLISVFNAASCDAADRQGCGQTPSSLPVGDSAGGSSALSLAIDEATNTVYATDLLTGGDNAFTGSSVYVIDGATCDARDTAGCNQTPATVTIPASVSNGSTPVGIAVNQATDTIYTADLDGGDAGLGTVGVIDGATCNGQDTTGCGQTPGTVTAGFGTEGVAVDPTTGQVLVNNIEDSSVSVLDGADCNAQDKTGCDQPLRKLAVGDYPGADLTEVPQGSNSSEPIAIDAADGTAYVQNINSVSVIPVGEHRRDSSGR
jgi:DNA-binding beta-propeller fold protein YncE